MWMSSKWIFLTPVLIQSWFRFEHGPRSGLVLYDFIYLVFGFYFAVVFFSFWARGKITQEDFTLAKKKNDQSARLVWEVFIAFTDFFSFFFSGFDDWIGSGSPVHSAVTPHVKTFIWFLSLKFMSLTVSFTNQTSYILIMTIASVIC